MLEFNYMTQVIIFFISASLKPAFLKFSSLVSCLQFKESKNEYIFGPGEILQRFLLFDLCFHFATMLLRASLVARSKESTCNAGASGLMLGQEDTLEAGMAAHSSILAWRIPWTEEPGSQKSWTRLKWMSRSNVLLGYNRLENEL